MSGAVVWRVDGGASAWALRRWQRGMAEQRIAWTHRVLAHAAASGASFVPVPVASDTGATLVEHRGYLWEFAPWMPGAALDGDGLRASLPVCVRALREFHTAASSFQTESPNSTERPTSIVDRDRRLSECLAVDWPQRLATVPEQHKSPQIQRIALSLRPALSQARHAIDDVMNVSTHTQPVLRDARPEHFLFSGDRVTGLVDFGAMTIDTVALDLARLLGEAAFGDSALWVACLDAYGPRPEQRRLVAPLAVSGLVLSAANWLAWIAKGSEPEPGRLDHLAERVEHIAAGALPTF